MNEKPINEMNSQTINPSSTPSQTQTKSENRVTKQGRNSPELARAINNLSSAIQFQTVSNHQPERMNWSEFDKFVRFLEQAYPLVRQHLVCTKINQYGLVFHWESQNNERLPVLLTAHYDVVPADDKDWPQAPFSGHIDDLRIWGRGSFDDKASVIAILETIEQLLAEDFVPSRDIFLAFGFDEECNGYQGARQIAAHFRQAGLHFYSVLDEGGAVTDGTVMGIEPPIAVIGLAEKGNSSFRFTFQGDQGHAATPPQQTAIGHMAQFINQIENHPLPPRLTPTVEQMLRAVAPFMKGIAGFCAARPKLFFPILSKVLLKNRQTAAMLRTTVAFTMSEAGSAPNVLPASASCVANVRILQGDTVESVLAWFKSNSEADLKIEPLATENPTSVSDITNSAYEHLKRTVEHIFPEAVVTPYLMTAGTDCRHYDTLAENTYRFLPCRVSEQELTLMHGTGEYLSIENLERMLAFYRIYMTSLD